MLFFVQYSIQYRHYTHCYLNICNISICMYIRICCIFLNKINKCLVFFFCVSICEFSEEGQIEICKVMYARGVFYTYAKLLCVALDLFRFLLNIFFFLILPATCILFVFMYSHIVSYMNV